MAFRIDGQSYTQYQSQVGCALKVYLQVSDETLGSILATLQNGLGARPHTCRAFVRTLQDSRDAAYRNLLASVRSNPTYWDREARRVYDDWMEANSQVVQRYVTTAFSSSRSLNTIS